MKHNFHLKPIQKQGIAAILLGHPTFLLHFPALMPFLKGQSRVYIVLSMLLTSVHTEE